jgi:hypothetical protein
VRGNRELSEDDREHGEQGGDEANASIHGAQVCPGQGLVAFD